MDGSYVASTSLHVMDPKDTQKFVHWENVYIGTDVLDLMETNEFEEIEKKSSLSKYFCVLCQSFLSALCFQIKTLYDFKDGCYQHISALGIISLHYK